MNKIESKREELENKYNYDGLQHPILFFNEGKLEGFNLGVEMARKEFQEQAFRQLEHEKKIAELETQLVAMFDLNKQCTVGMVKVKDVLKIAKGDFVWDDDSRYLAFEKEIKQLLKSTNNIKISNQSRQVAQNRKKISGEEPVNGQVGLRRLPADSRKIKVKYW